MTQARKTACFLLILLAACCPADEVTTAELASQLNLWGDPELDSGQVEVKADISTSAVLLDASTAATAGTITRGLIVAAGGDMTVSARVKLGEGVEYPADGPDVQSVGMVAPDILALTIQERERRPGRQTPYQSLPGDEIRNEKDSHLRLAWRDGQPALATRRSVWRKSQGKDSLQRLGVLVQNGEVLTLDSEIHGKAISMETLDEPRAYQIRPVDTEADTSGWRPIAVYRKSKPLERANNPAARIDFLAPSVRQLVYRVVALNGKDNDQGASEPTRALSLAPWTPRGEDTTS